MKAREEYSYNGKLMAVGRPVEDLFLALMKLVGQEIIDVRENKEYQNKKIDFLIGNQSLDIKNDRYFGKTGNLLLEWEYLLLKTKTILRCWGHSECEDHASCFVFFKQAMNGDNNEFWFYKSEQYLNSFWKALDEQAVQIKLIDTDNRKSTICFLFPINYCQPFQILQT